MEAKESFDNFCQQLEMEEECKEKAWNVWESVSSKIVETTKVCKKQKLACFQCPCR